MPDATRPDRIARIARIARDTGLLVVACIVAGAGSILAGQDANWDLRNYHWYNPWAWVTGRYGFDLAPAQLQTFHNALLDVPLHAMVAADWPPRLIAFLMAIPAGIGAFFLWKLAAALLRDAEPSLRSLAVGAALAIGLSGVNGIAMLGSTMNEWPGAALVIVALWLVVRGEIDACASMPSVALAGLLVGLASGLKLTAATYAVGMAVALLVRRPPFSAPRQALVFGLCVLVGIALTAGPWMAMLHQHYGSPLFPYFNQWLRSPLLPAEPITATNFGPRVWLDALTLPFDLLRPPARYVAEVRHRDARFPVVATLALLLGGAAAFRSRATAVDADRGVARAWRFVGVFFVTSFVVWAAVHSIYRYLLPLELLTGAVIVALVLRLAKARARKAAVVTLALLVVLTTRYPNWGRTTFGEHFVAVQRPPIEANALVVLTADAPMSWVLTRFPADARHVGIENNLIRSNQYTGLRAKAAALVASHAGPIYQLTPPDKPAERELATYGLVRVEGGCAEVRGNLSRHPLLICRLSRVPG